MHRSYNQHYGDALTLTRPSRPTRKHGEYYGIYPYLPLNTPVQSVVASTVFTQSNLQRFHLHAVDSHFPKQPFFTSSTCTPQWRGKKTEASHVSIIMVTRANSWRSCAHFGGLGQAEYGRRFLFSTEQLPPGVFYSMTCCSNHTSLTAPAQDKLELASYS